MVIKALLHTPVEIPRKLEKITPAVTKIFSPYDLKKVMQSKNTKEIKELVMELPLETAYNKKESDGKEQTALREIREAFQGFELIKVIHPHSNGEIFHYFPYHLSKFDSQAHILYLVLIKLGNVPMMIRREKTIQIDPTDQQKQILNDYHEFRTLVTDLKGDTCDGALKILQTEMGRLYPEIRLIKTATSFIIEYQNQKYQLNLLGLWWGDFTVKTSKIAPRFVDLPGFYSLNLFFVNRSNVQYVIQKMQLGKQTKIQGKSASDRIMTIARREQIGEQFILIAGLGDFLIQAGAIFWGQNGLFIASWWILLGLVIAWIGNKTISAYMRSHVQFPQSGGLYSEIPVKEKKSHLLRAKFHQWKCQILQKVKTSPHLESIEAIPQAMGTVDFKNQKIVEFLNEK